MDLTHALEQVQTVGHSALQLLGRENFDRILDSLVGDQGLDIESLEKTVLVTMDQDWSFEALELVSMVLVEGRVLGRLDRARDLVYSLAGLPENFCLSIDNH